MELFATATTCEMTDADERVKVTEADEAEVVDDTASHEDENREHWG